MAEIVDHKPAHERLPFWRVIAPNFLLATVIATVLGSIVQTQVNLSYIAGLGADIPLRTRIATTLFDLGSFGATFIVMVAVTLLLALPVAALLSRLLPALTGVLFFLAGFVGIYVAFLIADALLPMPTFVGATRGWGGKLLMMLAVGLATWFFARMLWIWRPYVRSR